MIWGLTHKKLEPVVLRKAFHAIDAEKHRSLALAKSQRERSEALDRAFVDKTFVMFGVERRQIATLQQYFDFAFEPPTLRIPVLSTQARS